MQYVCGTNSYERAVIISRKVQSELGQGSQSLSCPFISRPHFASPRESRGKAQIIHWGMISCRGCQNGKFSRCTLLVPHTNACYLARLKSSAWPFAETLASLDGALSGVATYGPSGQGNKDGWKRIAVSTKLQNSGLPHHRMQSNLYQNMPRTKW